METLQSELPYISIFNAFLTQVVVCWTVGDSKENATSITEVTTAALIRNFAYIFEMYWHGYYTFRFWRIRLVIDGHEVELEVFTNGFLYLSFFELVGTFIQIYNLLHKYSVLECIYIVFEL